MRPALLLLPLLVACQASPPSSPPLAVAPGPAAPATGTATPPVDGASVLPAPATATVVEAMENEPTPLHVGQILRITLQGNPSTGYRWDLAAPLPPQLVEEQSASLPQPPDRHGDTAVVGAPQDQWVYLRAVTAGEASVVLEWRRPWEKDQPPARRLTYRVSVR